MDLFDVNVLIYAHRADLPQHARVQPWFEEQLSGPGAFAMSELVLSAFVRIVTNPRSFVVPTPVDVALNEVERIRNRPNCVAINPGQHHFERFTRLCREGNARENLVADAYYAALAIESGCRWVTFDRDFARFPGLDWTEPDI